MSWREVEAAMAVMVPTGIDAEGGGVSAFFFQKAWW